MSAFDDFPYTISAGPSAPTPPREVRPDDVEPILIAFDAMRDHLRRALDIIATPYCYEEGEMHHLWAPKAASLIEFANSTFPPLPPMPAPGNSAPEGTPDGSPE